jgi:hypothetical protein
MGADSAGQTTGERDQPFAYDSLQSLRAQTVDGTLSTAQVG